MKNRNQNILRNEAEEHGGNGGGGILTPPAPVHFNPDGSFGEKWREALGDEFRPHDEALGAFKDVKGLAKSYLHFRSTGPAYPGEASQPEDVQRFRSIAQVPGEGTAAAYGITLPDDASEADRSAVERIAKLAHDNHLSGPGFQKDRKSTV